MYVAALFYSASSVFHWRIPTNQQAPLSFPPRVPSLQARHCVSQGLPPSAYSNSVSNFVQMNSLWRWRLFKAVQWEREKKKRSTNIVIRAFHCDWVLFISVCVCARVRAFGVKWQRFSTEPLWSCGVLLFTGWQTQWCIGRGRLGKKPTTLWWNRLCRHRALATYRRICQRSNPSTNKLLLFFAEQTFWQKLCH